VTVAGSAAIIGSDAATVAQHCHDKQCDAAGLAAGRRGSAFVTVNTAAWPFAIAGCSLAVYSFLSKSSSYVVRTSLGPRQWGLELTGAL
jgi:hypothetical protein